MDMLKENECDFKNKCTDFNKKGYLSNYSRCVFCKNNKNIIKKDSSFYQTKEGTWWYHGFLYYCPGDYLYNLNHLRLTKESFLLRSLCDNLVHSKLCKSDKESIIKILKSGIKFAKNNKEECIKQNKEIDKLRNKLLK